MVSSDLPNAWGCLSSTLIHDLRLEKLFEIFKPFYEKKRTNVSKISYHPSYKFPPSLLLETWWHHGCNCLQCSSSSKGVVVCYEDASVVHYTRMIEYILYQSEMYIPSSGHWVLPLCSELTMHNTRESTQAKSHHTAVATNTLSFSTKRSGAFCICDRMTHTPMSCSLLQTLEKENTGMFDAIDFVAASNGQSCGDSTVTDSSIRNFNTFPCNLNICSVQMPQSSTIFIYVFSIYMIYFSTQYSKVRH